MHASIADILEGRFIEKILNDLHYRSNLFNIKDLDADGALVKSGVELREFRKELIGDIDIVIVPREHPESSTAIQVKRFPVKVTEDGHSWQRERMQRLFQKGITQANYAAQVVGFSQVYLWTFVLADTRWQNGGRYTYDGPDASVRSEIECVISRAGLDSRIGLVSFEWVQPMDRPPLELAAYGGHLRNIAGRQAQPAELTEWLRSLRPDPQRPRDHFKLIGLGNKRFRNIWTILSEYGFSFEGQRQLADKSFIRGHSNDSPAPTAIFHPTQIAIASLNANASSRSDHESARRRRSERIERCWRGWS